MTGNAGLAAPYWLRLVRSGNTFTSYVAPDGVNWTQTGTTTVSMNANVYVGLAVCSHNDGTICQAQFDNVILLHLVRRHLLAAAAIDPPLQLQ